MLGADVARWVIQRMPSPSLVYYASSTTDAYSTSGSNYGSVYLAICCSFNDYLIRHLIGCFSFLWQTTSANCLVVGEQHIFVGCADGIVRCFSPFTLQFVTTLPRTHYLGVDVAKGLSIRYHCSSLTGFVACITCFHSILFS